MSKDRRSVDVEKLNAGATLRLRFERLEPRILLSAELGPGIDGSSSDELRQPDHHASALQNLLEVTDANRNVGTGLAPLGLDEIDPWFIKDDAQDEENALASYLVSTLDSVPVELIFVDTSTANYEAFIADIQNAERTDVVFELVLIDGSDNGLEIIANALTDRADIQGIHIVSHGDTGGIKLGNVWLDSETLTTHQSLLSGWGLREGVDLLIYGCNLGRDANGLALIDALAKVTGTDVAASDDLTGAAVFGADWDLEVQTGKIETQVPFSDAITTDWLHVLAPPTTTGIADIEVEQGAADSVISLLTVFSDVEDNDADLVYSITGNTNAGLFSSTALDQSGNTLTLSFNAGAYGSADITVTATDSDTETITTTFTVTVNPESTLLLSTAGDAAVTIPGLASWTNSDLVEFGSASFALGGTTTGQFSNLGNLGGDIDALHYVSSNITLGVTNTITLQPGDLLVSYSGNETLVSTAAVPEGNLSVSQADIVLVRPDTPGDYSAVNYFMILDNVSGGVDGLSLVEEDTIVGDVLLSAGDILIAPGTRDVNVYKPSDLSDASTGTTSVLIDGDDLRDSSGTKMINRFVVGVELVENSIEVGGVTLNSGNIILTVGSNSASVLGTDGTNPDTRLTVTEFDLFVADVTRTSVGADPLEGTATLLLEGLDVDLSDRPNKEDIHAVAIKTFAPDGIANTAPVGVADVYTAVQGATLTVSDSGDFVVANDTDADGDTLGAVLVTGPADATAFTLNTDGSFTYTHNGAGLASDSFTYAVGDGKGGISTATVTINITPNVAPTSTDNTISVTESVGYTLQASEFNFSDADGDTLASIKVTSLEAAGVLTLNGVDVVLNQVITKDDIDNNLLVYTPVSGENGAAYDTFKFTVNDGFVDSTASSTLTVDVVAVNEAPTALNMTSASAYNTGETNVALTDIVVTDGDVTPAQTITATLTLSNTLTGSLSTPAGSSYNALTGVWTITDTVSNVNAALGSVEFLPTVLNVLDATIATHIEDQDGAGPADGVISLNVNGNQAPTATNLSNTTSYSEGDASVALDDIVVSDPDSSPAQTITATLTLSDPAAGVLTTSGSATYTAGTGVWTITDTVSNVNTAVAGVSFTPAANYDVDATITTHIEDQDGAGPADGVITLDVTPANDAPTATNLTATVVYSEGDASAALADIVVTDSDTNPAQTITATLTLSDPAAGVLTTSGSATYTAGTGVWTITDTVSNVNTALAGVSFTPAANYDVDATITTHIEDQNGAGPADGVITLDVTPANDAPTATNLTATVVYTEGDASAALADIVVTDSDTNPAQTITATLTLSDPAAGVLTTSGSATYTAGTGVWTITDTVSNVNTALAGVSFTPAANYDVDATITTHIEDQDGAGPADGVITLDVTPANDAPTATNLTATVVYTEGDASAALADIVVTDSDTNPSQTITATLTLSDPAAGVLTTSGSASYTAGTGVWTITDTVSNVNTALASVSFTPAANYDVDATITTHIEDQDGAGPADGVITLDVTPANDAPTATNLASTATYNVGDPSVDLDDIVVTEIDLNPVQTLTVTLTLADPATGTLTTSGSATYTPATGVWNITDSAANVNLALSNVSFLPQAANTSDTTILVQIADQDGAGPADGLITLDVASTNSAPVTNNNTITTNEDSTRALTTADFPFTDSDAGDSLSSIEITSLETSGRLVLNGVDVSINQVVSAADLDAGLLTFTPDGDANGAAIAAFGFTVNDGDVDSAASGTLSFNVTPVNDSPLGELRLVGELLEGQVVSVDASNIEDVDGLGTLDYQWLRDGIEIPGANSSTYSPAKDDVNTALSVEVSYLDAAGTSELLSLAAGTVINVNDEPTGELIIQGVALEGEVLSIDSSGVADEDGLGTFSFQWQRDGIDIPGATSESYLLLELDIDSVISAVVSYTDDNDTQEKLLSNGLGPILGLNEAPRTVGLSDVEVVEDSPATVLAIADGFNDPDDDPLEYTLAGVSDASLFSNIALDADGNLTLTYEDNASGVSTISILATDPDGENATATFQVTVEAAIDIPQGVDDVTVASQSDVVTLASPGVLANDIEGDAGELSIIEVISGNISVGPGQVIAGNAGGSFTVAPDGAVSFNPGSDFRSLSVGQTQDTVVVYVASDGDGNVISVPIRVTVIGENDPVVAADDIWSVQAGNTISAGSGVGLLANDFDADQNDTLQVVALASQGERYLPGDTIPGGAGGEFVVQVDGSFTFEPGSEFVGLAPGQTVVTSIEYEVTDNRGSTRTALLEVSVVGVQVQSPAESVTSPAGVSTPATAGSSGNEGATSDSNSTSGTNVSSPAETTSENASDGADTDTSSAPDETENSEEAEEAEADGEDADGAQDAVLTELRGDFDLSLTADIARDIAVGGFQTDLSVSDQLSSTVLQASAIDIDPLNGIDGLAVQGFQDRGSIGLLGSTDSLVLISSPDYSRTLDESREAVEEIAQSNQTIKGGSLTISAGVSIGYVIYLIRSGVILSSVLTALPAWRLIDPLPILGQFEVGAADDEESIEEIVQSGDAAKLDDGEVHQDDAEGSERV